MRPLSITREVLLSAETPDYFSFYKADGDQLFVKQPAQGGAVITSSGIR